jgi:hypothetical protein
MSVNRKVTVPVGKTAIRYEPSFRRRNYNASGSHEATSGASSPAQKSKVSRSRVTPTGLPKAASACLASVSGSANRLPGPRMPYGFEKVPTYVISQALNLGVVYKASTVVEAIEDWIQKYSTD